jgi:hypothetical protein
MKKFILATALVSSAAFAGPAPLSPARAEVAFWDCDFQGSKMLLGAGEAALCSETYEQIKKNKFNGDFTKLMAWWKANKVQEHAKREKK